MVFGAVSVFCPMTIVVIPTAPSTRINPIAVAFHGSTVTFAMYYSSLLPRHLPQLNSLYMNSYEKVKTYVPKQMGDTDGRFDCRAADDGDSDSLAEQRNHD